MKILLVVVSILLLINTSSVLLAKEHNNTLISGNYCGSFSLELQSESIEHADLTINTKNQRATFNIDDYLSHRGFTEGNLRLDKNMKSVSGCPILSYSCYCGGDDHDGEIEVSLEESLNTSILVFNDRAINEIYYSPLETSLNLTLQKTNSKPEAQEPDQEQIIKALHIMGMSLGSWKIENTIKYKKYTHVASWSCHVSFKTDSYCLCDSNLPKDILSDNPTCNGFDRQAFFGVSLSNNKLTFELFKKNFGGKFPFELKTPVKRNINYD